jgi:hypothetical protein
MVGRPGQVCVVDLKGIALEGSDRPLTCRALSVAEQADPARVIAAATASRERRHRRRDTSAISAP